MKNSLNFLLATVLSVMFAIPLSAEPFKAEGQRLLLSGVNATISYAVVPAQGGRPTLEFMSLFTDKDDPSLTFYSSGAAIPLIANEGVAGTCTVANSAIVLETNDIVVSHDSVLDTWQRHVVVVNESNSNLIVLDPAPTGSLLAGDVLYEMTSDVALSLRAPYGPTPTNGAAARIPHMTLSGHLYSGRPNRPVLVEFAGTTNAPTTGARIDMVNGNYN